MMVVEGPQSWARMLFEFRGTVLRRIWGRLLVVVGLACVVTVVHLRSPLEATLTTTPFSLIGLALSIVLGFRNSTCFDRFWEARQLWGRLINLSRSFTRQALTLIDPARAGDEGARLEVERTQRLLVLRCVAFAHALRMQLRGDDDRGTLVRLLGEEETAAISATTNVPFAISMAMGERLAHVRRRGWIDPLHVPVLEQTLVDLTDVQGGCERIRNTPIPIAYSLLIHRIVGIYCLSLPFGIIDSVKGFTPLVVLLVAYAFFGLDAVGDEIEDPFGTDPHDLPLTAMSTVIERNLRERLGDADLPPAPRPVDGVLV
jgi:ion channel-forming bestrophin family protein